MQVILVTLCSIQGISSVPPLYAGHQHNCQRQKQNLMPCLTLCDAMDGSPVGSSVHGTSQARILEYISISFSRESS